MIKRGAVLVVALIAAAAVLSGGAAAVNPDSDSLPDHPNVTVDWEDGYGGPAPVNTTGNIDVDTSSSSDITPSNVSITRSGDGPSVDVTTEDIDLDDNPELMSTTLETGGGFDIAVDGTQQLTVNVDTTVDPHVSESDAVNHSVIEDADEINVTVDVSEIIDSNTLVTVESGDNATLRTARLIESDSSYDAQNTITEFNATDDDGDGEVTFNLSQTQPALETVVREAYTGSVSDKSSLVVDESVVSITITDGSTGETMTVLSDGGGDGGSGQPVDGLGNGMIAAIIAAIAVIVVAARG